VALEIQIEKKLRDFTLEVSCSATDQPLAILGPSGAGKTMLLRCVAGLENPDRGRIRLNHHSLFDSEKREQIPPRQRQLGLLFQQYALLPHRTIAQNIGFGLHTLSEAERSSRVAALVKRTHLEGLEQRYPGELSGGEQQRAALARALAIEPEALLLDEPLSALDTHLRSQVEILLQETFAAYRRPAILVTHNMEEAYRLCGKLAVLSRGKVAASGDKEAIFRRPPTQEVARLTGCKNFSRARMISEHLVEALDWGCQLRIAHSIPRPPSFVGIRANHLNFLENSNTGGSEENVFPCRLVNSSETPFRMTLFLRLEAGPGDAGTAHLQAEVYKEKWDRLKNQPFPWHIRLSPDSLFLLAA
jgi:molybdate transport system ATP-binding protein/molybdate transport system permease protein